MFQSLAAAIAFYTCLPIPSSWSLDFRAVSRMAPTVGLLLGGLLVVTDLGLMVLGMPLSTRSAIVVATWLALTGGLHMDGAMDTADGLAVTHPERRLAAMTDSYTGAFGAMVAVVILGLKYTALNDLDTGRGAALLLTPMWGRWGQQIAIAAYPYLKPTGKGAFHKAALPSVWLVIGMGVGISLLSVGVWLLGQPSLSIGGYGAWGLLVGRSLGMAGIAIATGAWLNSKLGGHTGDTYGAVVEWTEVGILILLTML